MELKFFEAALHHKESLKQKQPDTHKKHLRRSGCLPFNKSVILRPHLTAGLPFRVFLIYINKTEQ
jgi:hypothetical protein